MNPTTHSPTLLKVQDLHTYYGNIHALQGVGFEVRQGEIVTLIGGNGAGKTTTLASVSGMIPVRSGQVEFAGRSLTGLPAHDLVHLGMAHVPEGRRIFADMTVLENLEIGAFTVTSKADRETRIEESFTMFPRLKERAKQMGGTLSGGEQQMLALGRALMVAPRILLLDEPSMGLSPLFVERIFDIIQTINQRGMTILLVEQNAHMALGIAHRAYVLKNGKVAQQGNAKDLLNDDTVRSAYLGEG